MIFWRPIGSSQLNVNRPTVSQWRFIRYPFGYTVGILECRPMYVLVQKVGSLWANIVLPCFFQKLFSGHLLDITGLRNIFIVHPFSSYIHFHRTSICCPLNTNLHINSILECTCYTTWLHRIRRLNLFPFLMHCFGFFIMNDVSPDIMKTS